MSLFVAEAWPRVVSLLRRRRARSSRGFPDKNRKRSDRRRSTSHIYSLEADCGGEGPIPSFLVLDSRARKELVNFHHFCQLSRDTRRQESGKREDGIGPGRRESGQESEESDSDLLLAQAAEVRKLGRPGLNSSESGPVSGNSRFRHFCSNSVTFRHFYQLCDIQACQTRS